MFTQGNVKKTGLILFFAALMMAMLAACGTTEVIKEVPVEKIVEKQVIKEVPVEKIVETIKEVPVEKIVEVEKIKEVIVEKKVPFEVVREVIKPVPMTRHVAVPKGVTQLDDQIEERVLEQEEISHFKTQPQLVETEQHDHRHIETNYKGENVIKHHEVVQQPQYVQSIAPQQV